jgi:hypothetical protein
MTSEKESSLRSTLHTDEPLLSPHANSAMLAQLE